MSGRPDLAVHLCKPCGSDREKVSSASRGQLYHVVSLDESEP